MFFQEVQRKKHVLLSQHTLMSLRPFSYISFTRLFLSSYIFAFPCCHSTRKLENNWITILSLVQLVEVNSSDVGLPNITTFLKLFNQLYIPVPFGTSAPH